MRIVPARMHNADFLSVKLCSFFGRERQRVSFGDRKRVHVRTKTDDRPWRATFQNADDSGFYNAGSYLDAELSQFVRNKFPGIHFPIGKLWKLVKLSSPLDDLGQHLGRGSIDLATHIDGGRL